MSSLYDQSPLTSAEKRAEIRRLTDMGVPKGEWPLSLLQPSEESDHAKLMKDIGEEVEKRIERVIYRTLIWPAVAVALIYGLIKSCNSN